MDQRETDRLAALRNYGILDTDPEPGFDDLALLAGRVSQAPMALIGFFDDDRYWVKAQLGLKLDAMPRQYALYAASDKLEIQEIPDTLAGSRLAEHPMVSLWPKIRSYVGVPIRIADELVGLLSVYSTQPGVFNSASGQRLQAFARAFDGRWAVMVRSGADLVG